MSQAVQKSRDWWTEKREDRWAEIDSACTRVVDQYDDSGLIGFLRLHASAPNPNGISADISPDEWYVTLPYEPGRVDVETVATMLAEELGGPVTVRPRTDEWEPGFWLVLGEEVRSGGDSA